jgi:hypothetical protein
MIVEQCSPDDLLPNLREKAKKTLSLGRLRPSLKAFGTEEP